MSNLQHSFSIPHEKVDCIGDKLVIRVPQPPARVGSIQLPDMWRDVAQHNVVAGKILAMGPIAFCYQMNGETKRHDVSVGDWVIFRPFAGTMLQPDGKVGAIGGVRYLNANSDIYGIIKPSEMAQAEALLKAEDDGNLQRISA
jgi:co-chaperonin GroES (HSP10)